MIVVLDTNVIISAVLSPRGNPAEVFRHLQADEFEVAGSTALIKELEHALTYERVRKRIQLSKEELAAFLRSFASVAIHVEPEEPLNVIEYDPDDNRVLECALAAGAAYIVTGDKHLLELKEFEGIVILPPAGFLAVLELENNLGVETRLQTNLHGE